jgi:hypothetical protein
MIYHFATKEKLFSSGPKRIFAVKATCLPLALGALPASWLLRLPL